MPKKINVKKLRDRLGLTQSQMAEHLGVHQGTVHKLEDGEMEPSKPVMKLLEQLAAQL